MTTLKIAHSIALATDKFGHRESGGDGKGMVQGRNSDIRCNAKAECSPEVKNEKIRTKEKEKGSSVCPDASNTGQGKETQNP